MSKTTSLLTVLVSSIALSPQKLREVDTESVKFKELVESVKANGVMQTITVREVTEAGESFLQLIDGLHRLTAARHAGLEEIDVKVVQADDQEVLFQQIVLNSQRIETKPAEYQQQLSTILLNNPAMSQSELATRLNKSYQWLSDILKLGSIKNETIRAKIDDGSIKLINAVALSKLPEDDQLAYLDSALTLTAAEFVPIANKRVKEIAEAKRAARQPAEPTFEAHPRARTLVVLKAALADDSVIKANVADVDSVEAAFRRGIEYALTLTPSDIAEQQAKWEKMQEEKKQAAEERKLKRQAALEAKAKETVELASAE